jgi:hypothetical protein
MWWVQGVGDDEVEIKLIGADELSRATPRITFANTGNAKCEPHSLLCGNNCYYRPLACTDILKDGVRMKDMRLFSFTDNTCCCAVTRKINKKPHAE